MSAVLNPAGHPIGSVFYDLTESEKDAGLALGDLADPTREPGDPRRYGVGQPVEIWVEEFGAVGDSTATGTGASDPGHDDAPAFQAAFNYGKTLGQPFIIRLGPKNYKLGSGIDCSGSEYSYGFRGAGRRKTRLCPTPFGASAKLFDGGDTNTAGEGFAEFSDFSIQRSVASKQHPILFYYPVARRLTLNRLLISTIGNTAVFSGVVFNCDWSEIETNACGWQPLYKEPSSSIRATITSGSPVVTTSAAVFDAGDVGRTFYVQQNTQTSGVEPNNSALAATIVSVDSDTQVTLDRNCFATGSNRTFSFDCVKGSIANGTNTLTLDTDCLDSSDEGRFIYIDGAGGSSGRHMLAARIAEVTSANTCTIDRDADSTATDRDIWFTPAIYLGELAMELSLQSTSPLNDFVLTSSLIENFRGPGIIFDGGTMAHVRDTKFHGRTYSTGATGFAMSRQALICKDTTRVTATGLQLEFGCHGLDSGYFILSGDGSLMVDHTVLAGSTHGGYIFDFRTSSEKAQLHYGSIHGIRDISKDAGIVRTTGSTASLRVFGGYVGSISREVEMSTVQHAMLAGGFRSAQPTTIADDDFRKYAPARPTGFVAVSSDGSSTWAFLHYRVTESPLINSIGDGGMVTLTTGALTGTTGTDGNFTVSAGDDGYLYIENRLGTTRTITVTFLC